MKKDFRDNGLAHFPQHKILELLLFYTIPRANTNEMGHLLIQRFGSISGVFDASLDVLMETPGIGAESATLIKIVSNIIGVYMDDYSHQHNNINSTIDAKNFMAHKFLGKQRESILLACLASNGKVVFCEEIAEGSPETVGIRPVDIIKTAIRANAVQVVLSHNHPHGISAPSSADLRSTSFLHNELKKMDILLYDHIIVAHDSVYSMRENGMIPE